MISLQSSYSVFITPPSCVLFGFHFLFLMTILRTIFSPVNVPLMCTVLIKYLLRGICILFPDKIMWKEKGIGQNKTITQTKS